MSEKNRTRNEALLRFILLPFIFLTVALLGGLRTGAEDNRFIFIAPPLITLVFGVLLIALFIRGSLLKIETWFAHDYSPLVNVAHALTLISLFFASAQAFNSVLPERGLFFWGSSELLVQRRLRRYKKWAWTPQLCLPTLPPFDLNVSFLKRIQ